MSESVGTRQAGAVVIKVLGLVWLLRAVAQVPRLIGIFATRPAQFSPGDYRLVIAGEVVSFILHLGIGWLLVSKGEALSRRLFAHDGTTHLALTAEDCLAIALAAVGVFIVAGAVPRLGESIINFKYLTETGSASFRGSWMRGNWVVLVGTVAEIVIGTGLFLKSRYLAALWSGFDTDRPNEPEISDDAP